MPFSHHFGTQSPALPSPVVHPTVHLVTPTPPPPPHLPAQEFGVSERAPSVSPGDFGPVGSLPDGGLRKSNLSSLSLDGVEVDMHKTYGGTSGVSASLSSGAWIADRRKGWYHGPQEIMADIQWIDTDLSIDDEDMEEFVPASLEDLLTPDERKRRLSRGSLKQRPSTALGTTGPGAKRELVKRSLPAPTPPSDSGSIWAYPSSLSLSPIIHRITPSPSFGDPSDSSLAERHHVEHSESPISPELVETLWQPSTASSSRYSSRRSSMGHSGFWSQGAGPIVGNSGHTGADIDLDTVAGSVDEWRRGVDQMGRTQEDTGQRSRRARRLQKVETDSEAPPLVEGPTIAGRTNAQFQKTNNHLTEVGNNHSSASAVSLPTRSSELSSDAAKSRGLVSAAIPELHSKAIHRMLQPLQLHVKESGSKRKQEGSLKALVARLKIAFKNVAEYKQILACKGSKAQSILDLFQMVNYLVILLDLIITNFLKLLDNNVPASPFRRDLIVAMRRLSQKTERYPRRFDLEDIQLLEDHPVAAGSFADIYKGQFQGELVCLKVIRAYQSSLIEHMAKVLVLLFST